MEAAALVARATEQALSSMEDTASCPSTPATTLAEPSTPRVTREPMAGASMKRWDEILRDISSGEDSDEGDTLNLQSVVRNAHRVVDVIHTLCPGLDATQAQTLPMGMSDASLIRDGLAAMRGNEGFPHSHVPREAPVPSKTSSEGEARPSSPPGILI